MTFRDWLTFRFPLAVALKGDALPEQFMLDLGRITAPRFSTAKAERRKPLRGKLEARSGRIGWPLNEYRLQSPRSLHFQVSETPSGMELKGEFVMWTGFRVVVLLWLWCGMALNLEQATVPALLHHQPWRGAGIDLLFCFVALFMSYGYAWLCIAVGRRRERDLLRVLEVVMRGPEAAGVVEHLMVR